MAWKNESFLAKCAKNAKESKIESNFASETARLGRRSDASLAFLAYLAREALNDAI